MANYFIYAYSEEKKSSRPYASDLLNIRLTYEFSILFIFKGVNMKKEVFMDYINRFNNRDATAFEDYLDPNCVIVNGTLVLQGMQGMKDHYHHMWQSIKEELNVERFISDDNTIAIQMWTHFIVEKDDDNSVFGKVKKGELFDYHGIIMYELVNNKYTSIKVSYLSFSYTDVNGNKKELGIPH
jgi:hypothetical protein